MHAQYVRGSRFRVDGVSMRRPPRLRVREERGHYLVQVFSAAFDRQRGLVITLGLEIVADLLPLFQQLGEATGQRLRRLDLGCVFGAHF